jgi:hypothetical protein
VGNLAARQAIDKVIVSVRLIAGQTEPWQHNTRIIRRA